MAQSCKSQSVQLRFRDNSNKIHGPFETKDLLPTLASLYETRKLRKYYDLDRNNRNTFNAKLFTLLINGYTSKFNLKFHINYLWAIKMLCYGKTGKYRELTALVIYVICLIIVQFAYLIHFGSSLINIKSNSYGIVFMIMQMLSVVLSVFVFSKLTQTYDSYFKKNLCKPKLISSYHRKVSKWVSKYNNMSVKNVLSMIIPANSPCWVKACRIFICLMSCFVYVWLLPMFYIYSASAYLYPENRGVKWVLPDYYDIQQDITYFILNKLTDVISNDAGLSDAIYHILNVIVAHHIHSILLRHESLNQSNNMTVFCKQYNIKTAKNIIKSHLLCLTAFLKSRTRIIENQSNDKNAYTDHGSICAGIHTFDHKDICLKDYEYFQYLCGFNVNEIKTKNWIRKLMAFVLRRCHKYIIPLMPVSVASILTATVSVYYIDNSYSIKRLLPMLYDLLLAVIILFIILWIKMIYDYYNDFNKITKNVTFWMNPDLLVYLHRFQFDRIDAFITRIIRMSIISIEGYLEDLNQNNIYYQAMKTSNCVFPAEISQIILDFVCVYNMRCNPPSQQYEYDVDQLEKEVNEMVTKTEELVREYKQNTDIASNNHRTILMDTQYPRKCCSFDDTMTGLLNK